MGRSVIQLQELGHRHDASHIRDEAAAELRLSFAAVVPHVATGMLAHLGQSVVEGLVQGDGCADFAPLGSPPTFGASCHGALKTYLATVRRAWFQIEEDNLGATIHEVSAHGCG